MTNIEKENLKLKKEIEKLKETVHDLEIDFPVATQKIDAQYQFVSEKTNLILDSIKSLQIKVDGILSSEKIMYPSGDSLVNFLSRYKTSIHFTVIIFILIVSPESIKGYVSNYIL